jgi:serine kinase of HPr protein (carbohydrate metabolism regulator)
VAAELVHATAIAFAGRAVLLRGASGAGKSDLALRCLALAPSALLPEQAELVSDDQVLLEVRDGCLYARAPATITNLLEVRGLGIHRLASAAGETPVTLAADLLASQDPAPDRLPSPWPCVTYLGVALPLLRLRPWEASAPIKLLMALSSGPGAASP